MFNSHIKSYASVVRNTYSYGINTIVGTNISQYNMNAEKEQNIILEGKADEVFNSSS